MYRRLAACSSSIKFAPQVKAVKTKHQNNLNIGTMGYPSGVFYSWARWDGGPGLGILCLFVLLFVCRGVPGGSPTIRLGRPRLGDPPWATRPGRPTKGDHPLATHSGRPTWDDPPWATHPPRSYSPLAGVRYT